MKKLQLNVHGLWSKLEISQLTGKKIYDLLQNAAPLREVIIEMMIGRELDNDDLIAIMEFSVTRREWAWKTLLERFPRKEISDACFLREIFKKCLEEIAERIPSFHERVIEQLEKLFDPSDPLLSVSEYYGEAVYHPALLQYYLGKTMDLLETMQDIDSWNQEKLEWISREAESEKLRQRASRKLTVSAEMDPRETSEDTLEFLMSFEEYNPEALNIFFSNAGIKKILRWLKKYRSHQKIVAEMLKFLSNLEGGATTDECILLLNAMNSCLIPENARFRQIYKEKILAENHCCHARVIKENICGLRDEAVKKLLSNNPTNEDLRFLYGVDGSHVQQVWGMLLQRELADQDVAFILDHAESLSDEDIVKMHLPNLMILRLIKQACE